jgi:acetate kinase
VINHFSPHMKILVANLGSTSFKYCLFEMPADKELARGSVERIGSDPATPDHAVAVSRCLSDLVQQRRLSSAAELAGIGFKAVHAKGMTGVRRVDDGVLDAMESYGDVAPAHNRPYVRAMRMLRERLQSIPIVAAFESGFHETMEPKNHLYAVPFEWANKHGVRRYGFHGASHRYIAERTAQLLDNPGARIISCHLGGSSSLCAIRDGKSVANSLGFSPQTGLPHNNRVGDFDPFAIPVIMRETGNSLEQVLDDLANRSGLLGVSGVSNDLREIETAMLGGNRQARVAMELFAESVRHYLGAYLLKLNGAEAIVFTGGIGENSAWLRAAVCESLDWFGIGLDPLRNKEARGEVPIHTVNSRVQIWTMPTNEELVVARQTYALLNAERKSG